MKHGYVKVAAAVPFVRVADCYYNTEQIKKLVVQADSEGVELLTFPELSVTGYTCGDLFLHPFLLEEALKALEWLAYATKDCAPLFFVGVPLSVRGQLYNTAVAIQRGRILGAVPKTYLPNYQEFQEERWFSSGRDLPYTVIPIAGQDVPVWGNLLFESGSVAVGVEICEDMWAPFNPGTHLALQGAKIIFNLSASNELAGKNESLRQLVTTLSQRQLSGYVYASCGVGESTTDLVYSGKSFIAESGLLLKESPRFALQEQLLITDIDLDRIQNQRLVNNTFRRSVAFYAGEEVVKIPFELEESGVFKMSRVIDPHPFMPSDVDLKERSREMLEIQSFSLSQRLRFLSGAKVIVGVSGGLDSTLALLVATRAMDLLGRDRKEVIAVTMPGMGTTKRTKGNAHLLMQLLGVTALEIPIGKAARQHLLDIGHDADTEDITYENAQARERTQVLMDVANLKGGIVLGTGDLSEVALGWATYNGDHMSMFNINASIPKSAIRTMMSYLIQEEQLSDPLKKVLQDILDTPVSPELKKSRDSEEISQRTESILGPYEVYDFLIYHMIQNAYTPEKLCFISQEAFGKKYTKAELKEWIKRFVGRFFSQQFKRNCTPDGPKVGPVSLSPRGEWRMPSDSSSTIWLKAIEQL